LSADEIQKAWVVVDNWRSSHAYPLNHFQDLLRTKARKVESTAIVVQRQKRRHSIELKLRDQDDMQLSQMHDLGGCRAILSDVDHVHRLVESFKTSRTKCELLREYDYIAKPRSSGYRSVHLVYRYLSTGNGKPFNGLRIELQLRSALQHAWATAVEIAGAFKGQALKSGHGDPEWLDFFRLMGTEIALTEGCPVVPKTPSDRAVLREGLAEYATNLHVPDLLAAWAASVQALDTGVIEQAHYYILSLDIEKRQYTMNGFAQTQLAEAEEVRSRLELEKESRPSFDVVLVSADKVDELRKAYPNYSADTDAFVSELMSAIQDG